MWLTFSIVRDKPVKFQLILGLISKVRFHEFVPINGVHQLGTSKAQRRFSK